MTDRALVSLVGVSAAIERVKQEIACAATTSAKVMITGETGVGKEVVARLIHEQSDRRHRRFVAVNCSGFPETLLESELFGHARGSFTGAFRDKPGLAQVADGGTLFLDELGEMSLRMQAVLLRFAETGEVQPIGSTSTAARTDARLITATNRDLRAQVAAGEFREDLYYRMNVLHIHVPPLRERRDDLLILLRHFLRAVSEVHGCAVPEITPDAERALQAHHWPGNIRELKNVAERLVVYGRQKVSAADLPFASAPSPASSAPSGTLEPAIRPAGDRIAPDQGERVESLWAQVTAGQDFWAVVHRPFRDHDLTRDDLRGLVARALAQTRGSYRQVVRLFNLPDADYKRFLAFLSQHDCKVSFREHRSAEPRNLPATATADPCEGPVVAARGSRR